MHKRKWTRVLALLLPLSLCCALMLNLAASGNADAVTPPTDLPYDISGNVEGSPVVERGYTTLLAENNHFLDDNPNRGLRGFIIFTDFPNLTKETIKAQFDEAVNKRFDTAKVPCTTYVVYLYIGEYLQGSRSSASDAAALTLDAAFFEKADYIMQLFRENHIQECLENGKLDANYRVCPSPEDLYDYVRLEDIDSYNEAAGMERLQIISADGPSDYMRQVLNTMDEKTFQTFIDYHLTTCERPELVGAGSHTVDIIRKKKDGGIENESSRYAL